MGRDRYWQIRVRNISPDVALDALVLAQHISHSTFETNPQHYSLDVMVGDTASGSCKKVQLQCMEALRLVSAFIILDNLPAVLLSEAFLSQTQENDGGQAIGTLLGMCLDELLSLSDLSGLSSKVRHRGLDKT